MGIKNYLGSLSEQFPEVLQAAPPPTIDVLCIDLNAALHPICAHSSNQDEFQRNLCGYLDRLLRKRKPRRIAIFADGQAVLAKASIQRKRRQKHLYDADDHSAISTLCVTPGTPFMHFIDAVIVEYLGRKSIPHHYSPSTVPNEGEIKMFQWLRQFPDEVACIVGDDADLIVLALLNAPLLRVFLFMQNKYISIGRLVASLAALVDRPFGLAYHPVRRDVGLLSLLSGNDYLGHLVGFHAAMAAYRTFLRDKAGFLTQKNGRIHWGHFRQFVSKLECPPHQHHTLNRPSVTASDAMDYLCTLEWNVRLYTGDVIPNFQPSSANISIATLQRNFPREVRLPPTDPAWLHPDVYLLLLMPIVGRRHLPESLQPYMADESPIRGLFPDPCDRCIEFKRVIREIETDEQDKSQFRKRIAAANVAYRRHLNDEHPCAELPVEPIRAALFG
jgi:hypothetical protein